MTEARETLDAIRNGEVDAVVVGGPDNQQIYTLETADRSYRLLIEQMTDGAVMLSPDGAVLYSNQALAEMLRTSTGRLIGRAFAPFVSPPSAAMFARLVRDGGKAELTLRRPDEGGEFIAQVSLQPSSAHSAAVCGVVTDLTATYAQAREVAQARSTLAVEAARRESDERYRLILEGVKDYAILAVNLRQEVTIWNSGARDIFGWDAAEIIGKPMPVIWTEADLAAGTPALETSLSRETGRAEYERWHLRKDGSPFWAHSLTTPLCTDGGILIGFLKILRDRTEQRSADERQSLLINELNHRVKNTLATVQSIVGITLRTAPTPALGVAVLEARLMALSNAHDVLTRESWEGAELGEIVGLATAPYETTDAGRIHRRGPPVRLRPRIALTIAMALQELATNAVKYGALSTKTGRLSIAWTVVDKRLELRWAESAGPLVEAPTRRGFGSRLIERSLAAEPGGKVELAFAPTGVSCVLTTDID